MSSQCKAINWVFLWDSTETKNHKAKKQHLAIIIIRTVNKHGSIEKEYGGRKLKLIIIIAR